MRQDSAFPLLVHPQGLFLGPHAAACDEVPLQCRGHGYLHRLSFVAGQDTW